MLKYSFLLPAYKSAFLREAMESILAQSYKDFELIVVDDASPEDIKSVVDSFEDTRIRYYRNEKNIGGDNLVAQWNICLSYAKGEWVVLATDDDIYEAGFLATADNLLSKYPQVNIFRGRICAFSHDKDDLEYIENAMPEYTSIEEFFHTMYNGLFGGVPEYVFRKSELDAIGGFYELPKAWSSDDVTALLLAKNGIVCSGQVLVRFRRSGLNISTDGRFQEEKVIARFKRMAWVYTDLLPSFNADGAYNSYWTKPMKGMYPFEAKRHLLEEMHKLPWRKRRSLLYLIDEYTPYLNARNKKTMKFRVFFKIK